jgi:hypothetical protein
MFEGKEKATNGGPLVAAGFYMREKFTRQHHLMCG